MKVQDDAAATAAAAAAAASTRAEEGLPLPGPCKLVFSGKNLPAVMSNTGEMFLPAGTSVVYFRQEEEPEVIDLVNSSTETNESVEVMEATGGGAGKLSVKEMAEALDDDSDDGLEIGIKAETKKMPKATSKTMSKASSKAAPKASSKATPKASSKAATKTSKTLSDVAAAVKAGKQALPKTSEVNAYVEERGKEVEGLEKQRKSARHRKPNNKE